MILKRKPHVLDAVTGGQDSVGLRVPAHPTALALLAEFGGGIAASSANRYGRVSATTAEHVREEFGAAVDYILDGGPCHVGIESTLVSCLGDEPVLLRPGVITPSALAEVLGRPVSTPDGQQAVPRAPGSDAAHYASAVAEQVIARLMPAQANAYAQQLYAALRWADTTGADQLLIELPPEGEDWLAVQDRLARATQAG